MGGVEGSPMQRPKAGLSWQTPSSRGNMYSPGAKGAAFRVTRPSRDAAGAQDLPLRGAPRSHLGSQIPGTANPGDEALVEQKGFLTPAAATLAGRGAPAPAREPWGWRRAGAARSRAPQLQPPGRCGEEAGPSSRNFLESGCFAVKLGPRERHETRVGGGM